MPETPTAQGEHRRYLVVRSGSVRCALPVAAVRRVVRGLPVTNVPGSARRVVGLAHHDGDPIVVLDLLELLGMGLGAAAGSTRVTVVARVGRTARELVGLSVDEGLEVASLEVVEPPIRATGPVVGEAVRGGLAVLVLDPEKLLGGEEAGSERRGSAA